MNGFQRVAGGTRAPSKKGLIVNSTDLCEEAHRAQVDLKAHNAKTYTVHPAVGAKCGKRHRKRDRTHRR